MSKLLRSTLLSWIVLGCAMTLLGQVETGLIAGSVTDPSGAVVPSANITIKSVSTELSARISSNEAGWFQSRDHRCGECGHY